MLLMILMLALEEKIVKFHIIPSEDCRMENPDNSLILLEIIIIEIILELY